LPDWREKADTKNKTLSGKQRWKSNKKRFSLIEKGNEINVLKKPTAICQPCVDKKHFVQNSMTLVPLI
jgi:hypothetical protein